MNCGDNLLKAGSDKKYCSKRECKAARQRAWRESAARKSGQIYYLEPARRELMEWIEGIKSSSPCIDCGQRFPPECMDFDHVKGEKLAGVATLYSRSRPRAEIQAEIDKCELVCANCHRIRTRRRALEKYGNDAGKWEN